MIGRLHDTATGKEIPEPDRLLLVSTSRALVVSRATWQARVAVSRHGRKFPWVVVHETPRLACLANGHSLNSRGPEWHEHVCGLSAMQDIVSWSILKALAEFHDPDARELRQPPSRFHHPTSRPPLLPIWRCNVNQAKIQTQRIEPRGT